ncbi:hypothetical protein ACFS6H_18825 [Terrimonas rubra]|uniref:TIR domain-containing protein n=1 Tax=Terrimonas rubra TaxID=1035890 RepID=A0ABW6AAV4_9BACT
MQQFKFDIAISLCKEDVDFADKLVKAINPNLKVFFYAHKQDELISKSGPEAFARVFKDESRVVIILTRKEWGETFYTDIERSAIVDRIKTGFHFLMVIPMKQGQEEIPAWYPETHIYASPFRSTIEELAKFIEFKVADEGGIVKPLTLEDQYQNLLDRIANKKTIINLQHEPVAIERVIAETANFKYYFNERIKLLEKNIIERYEYYPFNYAIHKAHIGLGEYLLGCELSLPGMIYDGIVTTQDVAVTFDLSKVYENGVTKQTIEEEQRLFYYTPEFQGWALPHLYEQATNKELQVLFRDRRNLQYYDLVSPLRTEELIDSWFIKLLSHSSQSIGRYI